MKNEGKQTRALSIVRLIPIIALFLGTTVVVILKGPSYFTTLIETFSSNLAITTLVIMALFLFKSISFGLPYTIIYIAVGHIYPLWLALVVNTIGIMVNMQIPYFVGRYGGFSFIEKSLNHFSFVQSFKNNRQNSSFVFSFFVKFIGVVPHEITNLLLGSLKVNYVGYLLGGTVGLLPGMVATTIASNSLKDPFSLKFIISVLSFVFVMLFSYYLYGRLKKKS